MNPLASIAKSIRELEKSYAQCKSPETKQKANNAIEGAIGRMGWPPASVSVGFKEFRVVNGVVSPPSVTEGSGAVSMGSVTVSSSNGVTTVYPADYKPFVDEGEPGPGVCEEGPEVIGDLPGTTGEFETVVTEPEIGGWPERASVIVSGLAPNRRMIRGSLKDGRVVSVERSMGREWKPGIEVRCRLVRAGASPLYRGL